MRVRFVVAICASVGALTAVPAAASACPSLAGVKAFQGHTQLMQFSAQASGPDEPGQPQYGTESVKLARGLTSVNIKLNHKMVTRLGVVFFTGKASGGNVTVNDTFDDSRESTAHSEYNYQHSLSNKRPNFGSATLLLDPKKCKYELTVGFSITAMFNGEIQGSDTVAGAAYSDREHIPASLKLDGAVAPHAYHGGCSDSLFSGTPCYDFSGGFANDFMTLFDCHSAQAVSCSSSDGPVGIAHFAWALKPS